MSRSQPFPSRRAACLVRALAAAWFTVGATGAVASGGEGAADDLPAIWAQAGKSLTQAADPAAPQPTAGTASPAAPQKNYLLPAA
jgi:hypothetical protein